MNIDQSEVDALLAAAGGAESSPDAATATAAPPRPSFAAHAPPEVRRILNMRVPVIVKLAERELPVSSVLDLNVGSILEFERNADAELDLMVNNKIIGQGSAVKVGENFGLRLTRLESVQDTIKALGE